MFLLGGGLALVLLSVGIAVVGQGERGLLESTSSSAGTGKNRRKRSIWGKLVLERYKVQAEQLDEQAELQDEKQQQLEREARAAEQLSNLKRELRYSKTRTEGVEKARALACRKVEEKEAEIAGLHQAMSNKSGLICLDWMSLLMTTHG